MIIYDFTQYDMVVKIENSKYVIYNGNDFYGPFDFAVEVITMAENL